MILGDTETDPNDPDALQREYEAWLENSKLILGGGSLCEQ